MSDPQNLTNTPGGFCSSCGRALEAGATICANCGAGRVNTTDPDATIVARPVVERTAVTETVSEDVIVDDDPVVVVDDATPYWWWALGALAAAILAFVIIASLNDDDDDQVVDTTATSVVPVSTTVVQERVVTVPVPAPVPPQQQQPAPTSPPPTATSGGSSGSGTSSGPVAQQQPATAAQPFQLSDLQLVDDGGTFSGRAQIRNTGNRDRGGSFTVRLFDGSKLVGTLTGSVASIPAGSTSTVTLSSSDAYVDTVNRYEFAAQAS